MTKARIGLLAVAAIAMIFGLSSVIGALFLEDVTLPFRIAGFVVGLFLLAGASLLFFDRRGGPFFLWLSAATYAAVQLLPAFYWHGGDALSLLMDAFYFSLTVRVSLAAVAHTLTRRYCNN